MPRVCWFKLSLILFLTAFPWTGNAKDWTILIYMAAANNLTPYAYADLYEMEVGHPKTGKKLSLGSTENIDVLVSLETLENDGIRRYQIVQNPNPPSEPTLEDFQKNWSVSKIFSPVALKIPPSNDSEAQKLESFLGWGIKNYPSKHYMVVVWGHGQGWAPAQITGPILEGRFFDPTSKEVKESFLRNFLKTKRFDLSKAKKIAEFKEKFLAINERIKDSKPFELLKNSPFYHKRKKFKDEGGLDFRVGGLAFNSLEKTYLDIPSLRKVLGKFFTPEHPLDIYASDACLMQMLEVDTELSDIVSYTVGSAEVQSFVGLPYDQILGWLNRALVDQKKWLSRHPPKHSIWGLWGWDYEPYFLARKIPELLYNSLKETGSQWKYSNNGIEYLTMSLISNSLLSHGIYDPEVPGFDRGLFDDLDEFSVAVLNYINEDQERKRDLKFVMQQTPRFQGISQELGAFLTLLDLNIRAEEEVTEKKTQAQEVLQMWIAKIQKDLDQVVLKTVLGTRYEDPSRQLYDQGFKALSVWLPVSQDEFKERFTKFTPSLFYKEKVKNWGAWIKATFAP